ncbi:creatininase family protein [Nonomuraea sp. B10E15]|uniref:creatininase family protein n=1 Tax=Nonomuraea sp. B10E15 TaxID=3153560 RepID=UPI00325E3112
MSLTPVPRLAEMSWPQVEERMAAGARTVLFAAGSTEQHGPHLPLVTDTMLGDALADRVAARLPGVLLAPTVPFGVSTHHMAFPGTVTLDEATFKAVILRCCESLAAHGFETVLVLPSHGGNFAPLAELFAETEGRVGGARLVPYTDLQEFVGALAEAGRERGFPPEVSGSHAGEAETSIVLALRPDLVDMDRAEAGFGGRFDEPTARRLFEHGTRALSEIGVLGDPRPATARAGEEYLDRLTGLLTRFFEPYVT